MKQLASVLAAYSSVDEFLDGEIQTALRAGDKTRAEWAEARKRTNDQAYFILCFGQFETEIDELCRAELRKRQSSADWQKRRAWDLYDPADKRLSGLRFEDRVALMTDKHAGRGSSWSKIMQYYEVRNKIAHGELLAQGIDIPAVGQALLQIRSLF